jgi:uncharacterized SAM-binding protein YcdF (DUF218 family)
MFFILSKTLNVLLEPLFHPFLLLIIAGLARWLRKPRLKATCLTLAVALPLMYGFLPLSETGLRFLENRFAQPDLAGRPVDGIIVLGGHTGSGLVSEQRNQPQQNRSVERLTAGLMLHRQYPDVPLVFTGFSSALVPRGWSPAKMIQQILDDLGVPDDRILFEGRSRNTYENGVFTRDLVLPQPGARWILVTSANHMPRAVGAFQAAGWRGIVPYPVDYITGTKQNEFYNLPGGIGKVRTLLHEAAGLIVYRLTGRGSDFLPGPS